MLHVVAQRQLHRCRPDTWESDMQQARVCLQVLSYSGAVDSVAEEFHGKLFPIFTELSKEQRSQGETGPSSEHGHAGCESVSLLLTAPPATNHPERIRLSLDLMAMLGRPFRSLWAESPGDGRPANISDLGLPQLSGRD